MISLRTNQLCKGTRRVGFVDFGDFDCPTVNAAFVGRWHSD